MNQSTLTWIVGQVKAAISQSGLEAEGFNFDELSEMISRRHNIVHKADAIISDEEGSSHLVKQISVSRVKQYLKGVKGLKDYLLVQLKPVEYCTMTTYSTYCKGLLFLIENNRISRQELQSHLSIARGAMANIVRDLITLGHANIAPRERYIISNVSNVSEADELLMRFCKNHAVYREIKHNERYAKGFDSEGFYDVVGRICGITKYNIPGFDLGPRTLLRFFWGAGFISKSGEILKLLDKPLDGVHSIRHGESFARRQMNMFFGEAAPPKVTKALSEMIIKNISYDKLQISADKNCFQTLSKFGLIGVDGKPSIPGQRKKWSAEKLVRSAALENSVIKFVINELSEQDNLKGVEIGDLVSEEFNRDWSESSKHRNGSALGRWAAWLSEESTVENTQPTERPEELAKRISKLSNNQFGTLLSRKRFSSHNEVTHRGRLPAMPKVFVDASVILHHEQGMTITEIAARIGVSRATIYRTFKLHNKTN